MTMRSRFDSISGFEDDPRQFVFSLSRYKWVAKMLEGKDLVVEIGCADGWKSRIVRQHVKKLIAIDSDAELIVKAKAAISSRWPILFRCAAPLARPPGADAVYCLDVLEHVRPVDTKKFLANLTNCAPLAIIGTPSKESQAYASPESKRGHINCYSGKELRRLLKRHWQHVFMFSGHDEVIATSYLPMAHYLMALCVR